MTMTFTAPFEQATAILSVSEFKDLFFAGIPTDKVSNKTIEFYIDAATRELEGYLDIKILPETIVELQDFRYKEFQSYGYIHTSFPVRTPINLEGKINDTVYIQFGADKLTVKKTSSNGTMPKQLHIQPTAIYPLNFYSIWYTSYPYLFHDRDFVPNFWTVTYDTGFLEIPVEIANTVGKLAALNVFYLLGDLVTGTPGMNSKTISIDGLSQNFSLGKGGYADRISNYLNELKAGLPQLRSEYTGMQFTVL